MPRRLAPSRALLIGSVSLIAIEAALTCAASAQDQEIIVTGTRRSESILDVPVNIQAVGGAAIEQRGFDSLGEAAQEIPGLHVVDQGPRAGERIIVRGLSADPINAAEALNNGGGGTVATYVGEIPLYIDLKLNDLERIEFLLGPQGTLYGAGTLAGAVRYIPRKPSFDAMTAELRSETYQYRTADGLSEDVGATVNIPLAPKIAFRGSLDYTHDSGFIDYNFLVNEIGVSNPDPDFTNPADVAANLHREEDANYEHAWSGRAALRFDPADGVSAVLTYYYQNQDIGGRQSDNHVASILPVPVGEYESAMRVLEPNERQNELVSLEIDADLGFAELTSATGIARYQEEGHRDQTDFLITLEYSYEGFPTFTAFTTENETDEIFTQELRLVSKTAGPLDWIVGAFYNNIEKDLQTREFTPFFDGFLGISRPDNLEYIQLDETELTEAAGYGEVSYHFTPAWQVTLGARYFYYDFSGATASDTPMFDTFLGDPTDQIDTDFVRNAQSKYGWLYKVNTSYTFTDDVMAYFTLSQGYRVGGSNNLPPCPPNPSGQTICVLPNEATFTPDQTDNYELGLKASLFADTVRFTGDVFYVDWTDPQLLSTTVHGLVPITINGNGARTYGAELAFDADLTEALNVRASFSYAKAELTEEAPGLIRNWSPPPYVDPKHDFFDGEDGDRLPGSPETQGSLFATYEHPIGDGLSLDFTAGMTAVGDILTRAGSRGGGYVLPSFVKTDVSVGLSSERWTATLFADNVFDEYIQTGSRDTPTYNQVVFDANSDPHYMRRFYVDVAPPRVIGLRLSAKFGG